MEIWSPQAEQIVSRLIAGLPEGPPSVLLEHAHRLEALPIGGSLWAAYFLRPNGEVVVVGADLDFPDVDTIRTSPMEVLSVLVWGSQRYPELRRLLPIREPEAIDCRCRAIPIFVEEKLICGMCGGLGWLSAAGEGGDLG